MADPSRLSRARASAQARWSRLRERRPSIRHAVLAWQRMTVHNGGQFAGAITYFSFLALFPLLLLIISVAGFVLKAHPAALESLLDHITSNVPGDLGTTLRDSAEAAVRSRTSFGLVGLFGLLLAGLGWIANLRAAINAIWDERPRVRNIVMAKLADAVILVGLGIALVISFALTAAGTELSGKVLHLLGWTDTGGTHSAIGLLGVVLGFAGDFLIFWWLLVRLPLTPVPMLIAIKGALLASVGFEILKIVGTYTIASTAKSPTLGPFAGLLAVLVWIQLVARLLLFCAALTATLTLGDPPPVPVVVPVSVPVPAPVPAEPASSPGVVSLIGLGAAVGALVGWLAGRWSSSTRQPRG